MLTILGDLFLKRRKMRAVLPVLLEVIRCPGNVLYPFPNLSFGWVSNRSEEVTSRLARWAFPTHIDEVLSGFAAAPKEDLPSFVQDDHLVEDVINGLGCLINGNRVTATGKVGRDS